MNYKDAPDLDVVNKEKSNYKQFHRSVTQTLYSEIKQEPIAVNMLCSYGLIVNKEEKT